MSTALQRSIQHALAAAGRPIADDATLTTGVNELIAALKESEEDCDANARAYNDVNRRWEDTRVERDSARLDLANLRNTTASLRADLDAALTQRTTLIATADRRLYNARGVAFFSGVAVAIILEVLIRMAQ